MPSKFRKISYRRGHRVDKETLNHALNWGKPQEAQELLAQDGLIERRTPYRAPGVLSDVVVPAALAAGYALLGAAAGGVSARSLYLDTTVGATIGGILAGGVAYAVLTQQVMLSWWTLESYGEEGEEEERAEPEPFVVEFVEQRTNSMSTRRATFKTINRETLKRIAIHCLPAPDGNSKPYSRDELESANILSQPQYRAVTQELTENGILRDRDKGKGVELTHAGAALLRRLLVE